MKRVLVGCFAIAMLALLEGCLNEDAHDATGPQSGGNGDFGFLAVRLIDAPAEYEEVNIVVDSVRVQLESGDSLSGWYTISRSPASFNLLQYVNGRDTIIAEGAIPPAHYGQLRLYIGAGSNVVSGGVAHPLEIPSGSQSGLKINIQATIQTGVKYVVTLDFDATRSIVVTGNGRYVLKPVIKTVATAVTGSLIGAVSPDAARPVLWAIAGVDTSTTIADTTGFFKFKYLPPATYALTVSPADIAYRDTTLTNIVVEAGEQTDLGRITLQKR